MVAMGIPLLLVIAARARRLPLQALAAAAIPAMGLTIYYTFSRGGALELAVALIVLFVLYPRRLTLLPTLVTAGAGTAILILAARQRDALDNGTFGSAAHSQGNEMLAVVLVVCAGVALLQVAIALAARHEVGPALRVSRSAAVITLGVAVVLAVIIAIGAGLPGKLSDDWQTFKNPDVSIQKGAARFTSVSGNGRYQYWQSSVDANATDRLTGIGPGTWQFWWAEHATVPGPVINAHSLYFETFAELGIIGLLLIVGLVLWVIVVGGVRAVTASRNRSLLAGATASLAAFTVAAGVDWVWQIPAITVAFLFIGGAVLGSRRHDATDREGRGGDGLASGLPPRVILGILAIISLVAIAIPLAGAEAIGQSQAEVRASNLGGALDDARTARDIEPYSAAASLQEALVLELRGNLDGAAAAARTATRQEARNWQNWVVLSRIEAERGDNPAAIKAYRQAKSLNPLSELFSQ